MEADEEGDRITSLEQVLSFNTDWLCSRGGAVSVLAGDGGARYTGARDLGTGLVACSVTIGGRLRLTGSLPSYSPFATSNS